MIKNMTIKTKLILLASISAIGLILLSTLLNLLVNSIIEIEKADAEVIEIRAELLELRKHEKDFMLRKDVKYIAKFEETIKKIHKHIEHAAHILALHDIDISKLEKFDKDVYSYDKAFHQLSVKQQEVGLHEEDALYGSFRVAIHKVQAFAENSNNTYLSSQVFDLRKEEKDFMLRRDMKYVNNLTKKVDNLIQFYY